jgi:hypothetical protein
MCLLVSVLLYGVATRSSRDLAVMANGSAVDRIVPPELLSESLPFPMSLCTSREKSRHEGAIVRTEIYDLLSLTVIEFGVRRISRQII